MVSYSCQVAGKVNLNVKFKSQKIYILHKLVTALYRASSAYDTAAGVRPFPFPA